MAHSYIIRIELSYGEESDYKRVAAEMVHVGIHDRIGNAEAIHELPIGTYHLCSDKDIEEVKQMAVKAANKVKIDYKVFVWQAIAYNGDNLTRLSPST